MTRLSKCCGAIKAVSVSTRKGKRVICHKCGKDFVSENKSGEPKVLKNKLLPSPCEDGECCREKGHTGFHFEKTPSDEWEQLKMLKIQFLQLCTENTLHSDGTPLRKQEIADWWLDKFRTLLNEIEERQAIKCANHVKEEISDILSSKRDEVVENLLNKKHRKGFDLGAMANNGAPYSVKLTREEEIRNQAFTKAIEVVNRIMK